MRFDANQKSPGVLQGFFYGFDNWLRLLSLPTSYSEDPEQPELAVARSMFR